MFFEAEDGAEIFFNWKVFVLRSILTNFRPNRSYPRDFLAVWNFPYCLEEVWAGCSNCTPSGRFIQTARKISNGRKIARIAPIWTKICQNRSQRKKLSFEKIFRAVRLQKTCFRKLFRASRGLNKVPWKGCGLVQQSCWTEPCRCTVQSRQDVLRSWNTCGHRFGHRIFSVFVPIFLKFFAAAAATGATAPAARAPAKFFGKKK